MPNDDPKQDQPPLSAAELEQDAAEAGVRADELTDGSDDTYLRAGKSAVAQQAEEGVAPQPERNLADLPPG